MSGNAGERTRRGLPGPVTRLWRQPLRVGALGLLAVTALAASGVQSAAATALQATLEQNWRGLYDIVVTADGGVGAIDGMLPPNTLAGASDGLSLADLADVRGVDGVEVAAPVGEVVVPGLRYSAPTVAMPRGFVAGASDVPKAFRITATYMTDDGLGDRAVAQDDMTVVIDDAPRDVTDGNCTPGATSYPGRNGDYLADPALYPSLATQTCVMFRSDATVFTGGGVSGIMGDLDKPLYFTLPSAPQAMTRITLVDPVAERALLGDAGAFLEPLIAVHPSADLETADVDAWADAQPSSDAFASRIAAAAAMARAAAAAPRWTDEQLADLRALYAANGDDYDAWAAANESENAGESATSSNRMIPLLATTGAAAHLSVKIDVSALGDAPLLPQAAWGTGLGGSAYAVPVEAVGTPAGSAVADVSDLLNPFAARAPGLAWPGADLDITEAVPNWTSLEISRLLTPTSAAFGGGTALTLDERGFVSPERSIDSLAWDAPSGQLLAANPEQVGTESAYTGLTDLWRRDDASGDTRSIMAVPVGSFDPAALGIDADAANFVPLGAYAPVGSTLADGPNAGKTLGSSLSGLGLVSPRTVALASFDSAGIWGAEKPISAIRVRVGGIDGYTPEAQQRVIEVAQAIEELGFDASIVAGSSPTDADVRVDGYAFGTSDPAGAQTVGDLGTVTQRWSELGAAARVELSVSAATFAIFGIGLAAAVLLLGAVQVAGVPARRSQAAVMRELGFTRSRIARWFWFEEIPGLVIVALVAAAAWSISGGTGIAALAGLSAAGAVLVFAVGSVVAAAHVRPGRMPRLAASRKLGARTVAAFGARQVPAHPLSTVVHVLAIVIVGITGAALVSVVLTGQAEAGRSGLALLTVGRLVAPQAALGAAGLGAGILLAFLTRRIDLANRADQWATLRAAGWTSGQLARSQRVEGVVIAAPATAVAAAATWFGAEALGLANPLALTIAAAVAAILTSLIAFSSRRKGRP
ncbi:hypothetical protein [Agromyces protaetiae]|uniref:hypothetical protein n=1 Tax=Agromyces protaetiae TaxID=2509455 RepID=UPI0013EE1D10|nr:hypothetical protein [Agromyces protaetiae]